MKLLPMSDYVLKQEQNQIQTFADKYMICRFYALFLKQPLTLGMFVPCDDKGNVLEKPIISEHLLDSPSGSPIKSKNTPEAYYYRKAKERVLFEGFELHNGKNVINKDLGIVIVFSGIISILIEGNNGLGGFSKNDATIKDLVILDLILIEAAIKQIGI